MHHGSILLNFAARSPSHADATENDVLRDANEPDRSGHSGLETTAGTRAFSPTSSVTERDVARAIPSGLVNVSRLADGCHERSTVIIRRTTP
jgi:hypothetical protein